jgi:hypothetical protein
MSGHIEINESKSWIVAGWVFRNVIEDTLPYIPKESSRNLLRAIDGGFGEGKLEYIDLAPIPIREKEVFLSALREAIKERETKGSAVFRDPSYYPGYIERFKEIIEMVADDISGSGRMK